MTEGRGGNLGGLSMGYVVPVSWYEKKTCNRYNDTLGTVPVYSYMLQRNTPSSSYMLCELQPALRLAQALDFGGCYFGGKRGVSVGIGYSSLPDDPVRASLHADGHCELQFALR